jgi:hypothetical protein
VYLQAVALMFLALFAGSLSSLVRRADGARLVAGTDPGYGPGVVALMTVSQACMGAAALMAGRNASPELIRGMDEIAHIIAHLMAVPLGTVSAGCSAAMLLLPPGPALGGYPGPPARHHLVLVAGTFSSRHLLHGVGVLAVLLFMLWNVLLGISLLRRSGKANAGRLPLA